LLVIKFIEKTCPFELGQGLLNIPLQENTESFCHHKGSKTSDSSFLKRRIGALMGYLSDSHPSLGFRDANKLNEGESA
jgi:hypothetical protein